MENPIEMDDLGIPLLLETPTFQSHPDSRASNLISRLISTGVTPFAASREWPNIGGYPRPTNSGKSKVCRIPFIKMNRVSFHCLWVGDTLKPNKLNTKMLWQVSLWIVKNPFNQVLLIRNWIDMNQLRLDDTIAEFIGSHRATAIIIKHFLVCLEKDWEAPCSNKWNKEKHSSFVT